LEVVKTLMEAIFLVFLVMFLFLQNFRATMIPMLAVPVVLLGTFGLLAVFGYSINMLTMFALVLAIGLLVDDAIVVVENAERLMTEEKLSPRDAARKSMTQITGALVGIVLVLCAVLVPMAFFTGAPGVIYRQFSVTLVSALVLSLLVAVVLTPALCATIIKPVHGKHEKRGFFGWFNRMFAANTRRYQNVVAMLLKAPMIGMLVYLVIVAIVVMMFVKLPKSFLPDEDQGVVLVFVQLPAGATKERTLKAIEQVERYFLENEKEAVEATMAIAGVNFLSGNGQNMGTVFVRLKDWSERADPFFTKLKNWITRDNPRLSSKAVAQRGMMALGGYRDAMIFAVQPPTIQGLGLATGFEMYLQDRAGLGHEKLMGARNQLLGMARQNKLLKDVRPGGQEDTAQLKIDIDHQKAQAFGLSQAAINSTLSAAWGGVYINDFLDKGRVKRVYMQSEAEHRMLPENIKDWYVRNNQGQMVPFSAFTTTRWEYGSPRLERFNGIPAVQISGSAVQGQSSGTAMDEMEAMVAKLPQGVGFEWSGVSFQEKVSGDKANLLFALSLVVVFLCLAALYESWAIPFSVVLVVPLGIIGMLLAMKTRGFENDIFFHVGLVTIMGLSAKNAILIVEFAKSAQERGQELIAATLEAVKLRLRPVLMTSMAFGFGVLPLTFTTGAGSGGQNVIGTGVVGGLFSTTALGIFLIPVFFVVVRSIFKHNYDKNKQAPSPSTTEGF
jgi:multidrug efflux pump